MRRYVGEKSVSIRLYPITRSHRLHGEDLGAVRSFDGRTAKKIRGGRDMPLLGFGDGTSYHFLSPSIISHVAVSGMCQKSMG